MNAFIHNKTYKSYGSEFRLSSASNGDFVLEARGLNMSGQLGISSSAEIVSEWHKVSLPADFKLIHLAIRCNTSVFIGTTKGRKRAFACGCNTHGQLALGHRANVNTPTPIAVDNIVSVTIRCRSCFIRTASVPHDVWYACGDNTYGQLCLGMSDHVVVDPTRLDFTVRPGIAKVDVIEGSTFLHMADLSMYAAGNNKRGQLGVGHMRSIDWPSVVLLPNQAVRTIKGGSDTIFFIMTDGSLYATGWNRRGQAGLGAEPTIMTPDRVPLPGRVSDVQTISCRTLIALEDGRVFICGDNLAGFFVPDSQCHMITKPREWKVEGVTAGVIVMTQLGLFVQDAYGRWKAKGVNMAGELGLGHTNPVSELTPLALPQKLAESGIEFVLPFLHSTFFIPFGRHGVWAVGMNDWHQLGVETAANPVLVPSLVVNPDIAIALQPAVFHWGGHALIVRGVPAIGDVGVGKGVVDKEKLELDVDDETEEAGGSATLA
ncbi:Regulator of chromosome condensation (RCC1) repeat [Carpediemonas membranifera]|uniref:Regulator of chromosome condensation (RCC1) repeat n=1 Tax=Carpediemonas membranifera TaxID=201153 RepID=A0A8J6EB16_9EUKA|nr:Regulator of chromosome condensation (RCC1) repeat [Carpediemonas membranifera]|eukprot:KAG9395965.1 Regulator of chromosome condensation (RCC1) repeat [Carpediemonas membranifera]